MPEDSNKLPKPFSKKEKNKKIIADIGAYIIMITGVPVFLQFVIHGSFSVFSEWIFGYDMGRRIVQIFGRMCLFGILLLLIGTSDFDKRK